MKRYSQATGGDMEEFEDGDWVRFEDARDLLNTLYQAADVFRADQGTATDDRCGIVQPVSVQEANDMNTALDRVWEEAIKVEEVEADFYSDVPTPDCETQP